MTHTLEYYLGLPYRMEIIPDAEEGGYTAWYPDLPGCLTCGSTLAETVTNAADAKKEWRAAAIADGLEIPEPRDDSHSSDYSGQFKLRIPKSLHRSLAQNAKREGISMNQYCIYLLSKNDAVYVAEKSDYS